MKHPRRNAFKQNLINLSLQSKLLLISLLAILTVSVSAMLGGHALNRAYNYQLYRVAAGNLSISATTISEKLRNLETLSSVIISSVTIQNSLSDVHESQDARIHSNSNRAINNALATYKQTFTMPGLRGISLYNDQFANSSNIGLLKLDSPSLKKAIDDGRAAKGAVCWTIDTDHTAQILLSREVRKIDKLSLDHLGDLVIVVNLGQLVQEANRAVTTYEDSIYTIFDGSQMVYCSGDLTPEVLTKLQMTIPNRYSVTTIQGHRYFVVRDQIPGYALDYINLVPYDQINKTVQTMERWIIFVMMFVIVLTVLITISFIRFSFNDMDRLVERMDSFSKDPEKTLPDSTIDYANRTDELGRLHLQFEAMARQIQQLIKVNYVNQLLNKDAKLKALESQINPHFLYNTLETINWRAKAIKETEISSMTESLGNLLRATLSNKKSLVDLNYELNLVHSYVTIQKIRFADRLLYQEHIEPELLSANVPPLSIHPLLENAIRYGMEEMIDACTVILSIHQVGSCLMIEVRNEGSQFEDHLLEKLKSGEINPHGHGIGLLNIHQRIQILFGDEYGLQFENEEQWAIARIMIPYSITPPEELSC